MKQGFVAALLGIAALLMLTGCSAENMTGTDTGKKAGGADEKVTIRFFSNLPNRSIGQGLVEQMIIDEYMAENPNVEIQVEALDEEAYKMKFRAYSMDGMPDIVTVWGSPSFLGEVMEAGMLAALSEEDYADYGFIEGSLDGFRQKGILYGLPRNTDMNCFFYNRKLFEEYGWEVPQTYDELLELAGEIRSQEIEPVSMDGRDGWLLADFYSDVLYKLTGDYQELGRSAVANADFSDPAFLQALQLVRDAHDAGLFQDGYESQDYGTAMNLFTSGQAAMYYSGSWECSMALDEAIPREIRSNIYAFTMPTVQGGEGSETDHAIWNGGGYAVSADSEVKEEAIRFLNYMFRPDKLAKYGWENGVGLAAQDQSAYISGKETRLQLWFLEILNRATGLSGNPINDCGTSAYKTCMESEIPGVSNGTTDVDTFLRMLENACK